MGEQPVSTAAGYSNAAMIRLVQLCKALLSMHSDTENAFTVPSFTASRHFPDIGLT